MSAKTHKNHRVGLALGSGAARGWAHIGVIRALNEAGVQVDVVAGSSIGAVVGAAHAAGRTTRLEEWVRALDWQQMAGYFDFAFRGGLIKARRVFDGLEEAFGDQTIESLPTPYAAVATDLSTGHEVWLREGSVYDALRASVALPGLLTPAKLGDRWLVDGGLVNPVPVSVCRALGADVVIAVDLNTTLIGRRVRDDSAAVAVADNELMPEASPASAPSAGRGRRDRNSPVANAFQNRLHDVASDVRKRLGLDEAGDREPPSPSIYNVIANSVNIMQVRITRSRMAGDPADILIAPQLADFGLLDFDRADEAIAEGERAARAALEVGSPLIQPPGVS